MSQQAAMELDLSEDARASVRAGGRVLSYYDLAGFILAGVYSAGALAGCYVYVVIHPATDIPGRLNGFVSAI